MSPAAASITVGVLRAPARAGDGTYTGVCSGYLAQLPENGTVFTFVREPTIAFRPPDNPHVPMIMVGAGTGMAPFRGFLQERAALRDQGVPVAPSLLFFGCRNRETDLLYADELREYEQRGLVRVENAFSRAPRRRLPLRPGRDARLRRRGLGPAAEGGGRLRLRQRLHHRTGGADLDDPDLP